MSSYGIILFYTTSAAVKAEKLLRREGYKVDLIPAPREYSHDCVVAIRVDWDNAETAGEIIRKAGVETGGVRLWNEG